MPELPDVEIFCLYLQDNGTNKTIESIEAHANRVLKTSLGKIDNAARGHKLSKTRRHGKYLFAQLKKDAWLLFHFGMTGYFKTFPKNKKPPKNARLSLYFKGNDALAFVDPRMFGRVDLVKSPDDYIKEHDLGPDVQSLSKNDFVRILKSQRKPIKGAFLDQSVMAGLGNVYADEALFQAEIDPRTKCNELSDKQLARLYSAVQKVIKMAVAKKADPDELPKTWLIHYRKAGKNCPDGGKVREYTVSSRKGYYCPARQKKK